MFRDRFRTRRVVETDRGRGDGGFAARQALARVVDLITMLVVAVIVIGIVLVLLKANPGNTIVGTVRDAAKYLSKPFDAIITIDKRRTEIAVNWGIAAVVYLIVGRLISRVISR